MLRTFSFALLFLLATQTAARAAPSRALVLYAPATASPVSREVTAARMIGNLLSHFGLAADVQPADRYRHGGAAGYAALFYVQPGPRAVPPSTLVQDVPRLRLPVCWLGGGVKALPLAAMGMRYRGYLRPTVNAQRDGGTPLDQVRYRNILLTRGEPSLFLVDAVGPNRAQVLATAVSPGRSQPYALRSGSFWYFADSGVLGGQEDDRDLVFADLLHDLLAIRHAPSHRAIIRIEDVSVESDPQQLRHIADLLSARGVPFLISLIPVYNNPAQHLYVPMTARPEFVAAIQYMMARGGSVVMHGFTHQTGQGVSGDDAEFFDFANSRALGREPALYSILEDHPAALEALRRRAPVEEVCALARRGGARPDDANDLRSALAAVEDRLGRGLRECLAAGTPPVAWETPHYVASQLDYTTFARIFGTAVEQRLVGDSGECGQRLPFPVGRDQYGSQLVPENLGYVPLDNLDHVDELIRFARVRSVVRDGTVGCFFHPFLDLHYLTRLVDGIRAAGYTFLDLKQATHWVQFRDLAVGTGGARLSLRLHDELLHEYYLDPSGQRQNESWSPERLTGLVTRRVATPPGWVYVAEGQPKRPAPPSRAPRPRHRSWLQRALAALWPQPPATPNPVLPRGALVWEDGARPPAAFNQASYLNAFAALGISLERVAPADLSARLGRGDFNLLVLPAASASRLNASGAQAALDFVRRGGNLLTEGGSPVTNSLGLLVQRQRLRVHRAQQVEYPDREIVWREEAAADQIVVPEATQVLTRDPDSGEALVVAGEAGRGHYLVTALPYDERTDLGVSRLPYLARDALRHFRLRPPFSASGLHAYFDPDTSVGRDAEQLAANWSAAGITAIHAAAWKRTGPGTFDYDRLIDRCHRHGIAVYAWFELPMADQDFFEQHSEWQELTAGGDTAYRHTPAGASQPDGSAWRRLMAMEDPSCEGALLAWMKERLRRHPWDGVDLAELYFESDLAADPSSLMPMHPTARRRFAAASGFDPRGLVDPASPYYWRRNPGAWKRFENWRVAEVTRLHDDALAAIERTVRLSGRPLDVIVTVHDSLGLPTIRRDTGIDTPHIIGLLRRHDFSLQIEDPAVLWKTDPRRYTEIGERYRRLLPPGQADRLMLDLNVMKCRELKETLFPTTQQTGTEFDHLLAAAGRVARRVTLYAENSVFPDDWLFASAAFAAGTGSAKAAPSGWEASLRRCASLNLDMDETRLLLDGGEWPILGDGEILVPPGTHDVATSDARPSGWAPPLRLMRATVDLLSAEAQTGGLQLAYDSLGPGSLQFDGEVYAVRMEDGRRLRPQRVAGETVVMVPAGRHALFITQEEPWHWGFSAASFYCSTGITLLAGSSTGLLTLLYGSVRRRRRREFDGSDDGDP